MSDDNQPNDVIQSADDMTILPDDSGGPLNPDDPDTSDGGIASLASESETPESQPDSSTEAAVVAENWEVSDETLGSGATPESREELIEELDRLVDRIRAYAPGYEPPDYSPRRLLLMLGENIQNATPEFGRNIYEKLRSGAASDLFDPDTWKGLWFMLNYTIEFQADFIKRRYTGEYEVDEWGYDPELIGLFRPFFDFMYKKYWRVQTSGMEHIPDEGRAILVSNHSGQLPFDGAMMGMAVMEEHPSQRLVRNLYATWFDTLPFVSTFLVKMGQAMATEENGIRLLEQEQLVSVFPEGVKGVGKLYKDRYKLARFGRGGFVRMALKTRSPIIPVSVVGAEEIYISLYNAKAIARLIGFPFFPISITWPWFGVLGFVPLPTKWYIDFAEPIPTDQYEPGAENNLNLVSQLTEQVRNLIQENLYKRLAERRSIYLG
jgi:1-acyl-sn-glycerol-3-phosphate acyltransferase